MPGSSVCDDEDPPGAHRQISTGRPPRVIGREARLGQRVGSGSKFACEVRRQAYPFQAKVDRRGAGALA